MLCGHYLNLLSRLQVQRVLIKSKHKETHWSVKVKEKGAIVKALEHFDDFYKKVFRNDWASIRHGLLKEHKYVAVVNNYSDTEKIQENLENSGAINVRALFNVEKANIYENEKVIDRKRKLNEIFKLDKKMQEDFEKQCTESNNKIKNICEHTEFESNKPTIINSLDESFKHAEYDHSRIVHPGTIELSMAMYEFIPATQIKGKEDWIPETQYYKYYDVSSDMKFPVEKEYELHFPEHLNVYCHEKHNYSSFDAPQTGSTGVLGYYLLDGSSLLPVLALGLKPGDSFLDLCCAPAGKTYIALQTLYPDKVVCNDVDSARVKRIFNVLRQYFYDLDEKWLRPGKIQVTRENGIHFSANNFDCILVDVPCTNDRLSVKENDNNWFKSSRIKERLQLPETQAALLSNALKLVKVGGTVVYSTCSLSPIQNDGVVHMALQHIWEETSLKFKIKDLTPALKVTRTTFQFAQKNIMRYGHLVVPNELINYGPMYFCKLQRTE